MKTLYIECNMGAAGDMLMAALYELLDDKGGFVEAMNNLGLAEVRPEPSVKQGIGGTHMHVVVNGAEEETEDAEPGGHEHGQGHDHQHGNDHDHSHDTIMNTAMITITATITIIITATATITIIITITATITVMITATNMITAMIINMDTATITNILPCRK